MYATFVTNESLFPRDTQSSDNIELSITLCIHECYDGISLKMWAAYSLSGCKPDASACRERILGEEPVALIISQYIIYDTYLVLALHWISGTLHWLNFINKHIDTCLSKGFFSGNQGQNVAKHLCNVTDRYIKHCSNHPYGHFTWHSPGEYFTWNSHQVARLLNECQPKSTMLPLTPPPPPPTHTHTHTHNPPAPPISFQYSEIAEYL